MSIRGEMDRHPGTPGKGRTAEIVVGRPGGGWAACEEHADCHPCWKGWSATQWQVFRCRRFSALLSTPTSDMFNETERHAHCYGR